MTDPFVLDPRIEAGTRALGETPFCLIRMMNDRRYPWIVLIPRRADCVELFDLPAEDRHVLVDLGAAIAARMAQVFAVEKINVATLGNRVRPFHLHIVARHSRDAAWPDAVWNGTAAEPFPDDPSLEDMRRRLLSCLPSPI